MMGFFGTPTIQYNLAEHLYIVTFDLGAGTKVTYGVEEKHIGFLLEYLIRDDMTESLAHYKPNDEEGTEE